MRPIVERKKYEIAIFDFDDTIMETHLIYPFIHKELLRELGMSENEIAYLTNGYWHREVMSKNEHIDLPAILSERHNIDLSPVGFRKLRNKIEFEYFDGERDIVGLSSPSTYVIRPVIDDMKRMHGEGTLCFIVSHNYGNVVEHALKFLQVEDLIEDCYTHCVWDELMHPTYDRNEPKRDTFNSLAQQASDPSKCVVYDDMDEHIESAISLGMDAVKVDNEHAHPPNKKDKIC